jgi:hypothetical protein
MIVVRISAHQQIGNIIWDKKAGGDVHQDMGHALALYQNEDVLMVAGMKQPTIRDSE